MPCLQLNLSEAVLLNSSLEPLAIVSNDDGSVRNDYEQQMEATAIERSWISYLEQNWMQPDEGIWEVRGERQQFTHSKVMAWVAVDRAIKDFEHSNLAAPIDQWRKLRERIHEDVCQHGFSHHPTRV